MSKMSLEKLISDKNRIDEIVRLRLHEDFVDTILNEYVKKASEEFNLPVVLVSIVLNGVQKFAAESGLGGWIKEANATPVEWSFCANSIKTRKPLIIEDAKNHDLVKNNPLVTIDKIQCYAGAPMITRNGYVIGNFCIVGTESRSFSDDEVNKLKEYADKVVERLEARVA